MTIVFCFTRIFRNSHRQIFGLDELIQQGHEIILLDLSEIYGGKPTCDDSLMLELRRKCSNIGDLEDFRSQLKPDPVIYICNDTYLMFARSAFEVVKRPQDKLLAFRIKPSPFQFANDTLSKRILRMLFNRFISLPYKFKRLYLWSRNYYSPDYFMCTTQYDLPIKALLTVKRENIIIAHSDDGNFIVGDQSEIQTSERTGVFLDQILPFPYRGEIDMEEYYESLTSTLEGLQEFYDLDKVIIAEHPESVAVAAELKDKFKGFERSRGNTQRLVKNATYVFAHFSTSIGLAAYYEKPVILLLSQDLRRVPWINRAVNTYRRLLALPVIDMKKRDFSKLDKYEIDQKLYKDYVLKFIKDNNTVNENSYHFAIKRIIKDIQEH